jgi:GNAT superfamily N-acetyltransferase
MSQPADSGPEYTLREATVADAPVLARQRRLMFDSIEPLTPQQGDLLEAAIIRYIVQAMPAGTFRSWVVEHQGAIVSGGGLQLRTLMPRPGYVYGEPEGLIVSMWTEPAHRRRGLGRRIVDAILAWGRANGVTRFTLHASDDGRPLYELYGFKPTNEMRLSFSSTDPEHVTIDRVS